MTSQGLSRPALLGFSPGTCCAQHGGAASAGRSSGSCAQPSRHPRAPWAIAPWSPSRLLCPGAFPMRAHLLAASGPASILAGALGLLSSSSWQARREDRNSMALCKGGTGETALDRTENRLARLCPHHLQPSRGRAGENVLQLVLGSRAPGCPPHGLLSTAAHTHQQPPLQFSRLSGAPWQGLKAAGDMCHPRQPCGHCP